MHFLFTADLGMQQHLYSCLSGRTILGVTGELARLRDVFDQSYNFETEIWDIPSQNSDRELAYKIYGWRDRYCKKDISEGEQLPLLILYYGGHGEESPGNTSVWRR